jgi:4-aminobutyrate--pyruvate transaminase
MFGCSALGYEPDSITVAKALTSAYLPLAGVTVPPVMYEAMLDESHQDRHVRSWLHLFRTSVAAAVAIKALDIYARERIADEVARKSPHFRRGCVHWATIRWWGGAWLGLVGGIELVADRRSKTSFDPKAGVGPRVVRFAEEEGLDRAISCRGCRLDARR